jgi:magnesium transporter
MYYLYYALLDLVIDRYFPCIDNLESSVDELERAISATPKEEHLSLIHRLRGQANRARSIIWSVRDVTARLQRKESRFLTETTAFYLRDVTDHVLHLLDSTSMLRDTATGLMELYLSRVSNRMNEVMKVLTIISTLFIPITFVAGVYGMNFVHMPELTVRWAYPAVLGVMGVMVIGMLFFFKKRKWF